MPTWRGWRGGRGGRIIMQAKLIQPRVVAIGLNQLAMRSRFYNAPRVHDDNAVRVVHG